MDGDEDPDVVLRGGYLSRHAIHERLQTQVMRRYAGPGPLPASEERLKVGLYRLLSGENTRFR